MAKASPFRDLLTKDERRIIAAARFSGDAGTYGLFLKCEAHKYGRVCFYPGEAEAHLASHRDQHGGSFCGHIEAMGWN